MRAAAGVFLTAFALTSGCNGTVAKDVTSAIADALPVEQCVASQVEGGNLNPIAIGLACSGIAATAVVEIVEMIESTSAAPADAGAVAPAKVEKYRAFLRVNRR